jgi:dUTP pyrophosphatase
LNKDIKMKVKVVNRSTHSLPAYETSGAAGMDIRSNEPVNIGPGDTVLVSTGLFVAIPEGYEIQIRPRSGLSLKTGLRVANAPGTIDSCYRGEIKVIMHNVGDKTEPIYTGDRIAQMVLCPVIKCEWDEVSDVVNLGETDRGEGGFGSTGKQ